MITVTTPNGRIGSHVLRLLLERGETVRVVSHNPDKLAQSVREHCEVVAGSLDDVDTLKRALLQSSPPFAGMASSERGGSE